MIRRSLLLGGGSGRTAISTALHRNPLPISPFKPRWHPPPKNYDPQFGDYPNLPWVPYEKRDPYLKWDDPINRRNFGEPVRQCAYICSYEQLFLLNIDSRRV